MTKKKVSKKKPDDNAVPKVAEAPSLEERMAASRKVQEAADNHEDAALPRRNRLEDRKRANRLGTVPGMEKDDDDGANSGDDNSTTE